MKTLNISVLTVLVIMTACVEKPVVDDAASTSKDGNGSNVPSVDPSTLAHSPTPARVKNYNQYNMTLQKLTGLNRSKYNTIFEELKGSMPADNDIAGMTPFNLIAMTRLADAYCKDFVEEKIPPAYFNSNQEDQITDFLMDRFLDEAPDDQPDYYASLRTELTNIFRNDDGSGGKLFPNPSTNVVQLNKDYALASCVTILSGPYVTLKE